MLHVFSAKTNIWHALFLKHSRAQAVLVLVQVEMIGLLCGLLSALVADDAYTVVLRTENLGEGSAATVVVAAVVVVG